MKIQSDTIIFDFDGVLVDTAPDIALAANKTLQGLGLAPLPLPTVTGYIGGGAEVLMRRCLAERAESLLPAALPAFLENYRQNCCEATYLYPGVMTVLQHYARAGKQMAIATQKVEAITAEILNKLGIASFFTLVVGPESITHRKPHPESVLIILEKTATPPDRAVLIGDAVSDIQAGKAAGVWTCGVSYGYGSPAEIAAAGPDWMVDQLEQILQIVD